MPRRSPRSKERGPVEALHRVLGDLLEVGSPRSKERGPVGPRKQGTACPPVHAHLRARKWVHHQRSDRLAVVVVRAAGEPETGQRVRCGSRPGRARAWQAAAALQRVVADPGQSGATSASRSAASGRTRRGRGARDKNAAPAGQARRGGRPRPIRTSRSIRCRRPWDRPACRRRSRC